MVNQIEIFPIPNPCQRVCEVDKQGYCLTCFRSRNERFEWFRLSNEERQSILRLCKQRALRKRYHLQQQSKQQQLVNQSSDHEQLDLF